MPRTIAYLRVSTTGQTTDNQLQEIAAAGFKVEPRRVVTETVSGNVATSQRRGFTRLLDRLELGDVLVVNQPKHDHARAGRQCLRCDASPRDKALSDGSLSGWCSACRVSALPAKLVLRNQRGSWPCVSQLRQRERPRQTTTKRSGTRSGP